MKLLEGLKLIRRRNGFHAIIVLTIIFLEKKCWMKWLFKVLRKLINQAVYHCELYPESFTEEGICTLRLPHPYNIVAHGNSRFGIDNTLFQNVTLGVIEQRNFDAPQLGNNIYIGCNSVLLGGVIISDDVKVGAMTIVLRDVEKGSTVCGVVK